MIAISCSRITDRWFVLFQLQPVSIVSYNHLGNNDGKNLSAPKQFRSKEVNVTLRLCWYLTVGFHLHFQLEGNWFVQGAKTF